jgi:starch synthase
MFPSSALHETGIPNDGHHLLHQDQLREGRINFLLHGIMYAHAISTVSPTYAAEIRTPEYGAGLEWALRERGASVVGILNGVDYHVWNPETDTAIPFRYSAADLSGKLKNKQALLAKAHLPYVPNVPLFGIVSRLAGQKGFALCEQVLPSLLHRERFQLIVTGTGERHFERMFRALSEQFPTQVRFQNAFDNEMAHQVEAASDFFLMPSRYEPCGLNQMYSLKYGTVPIVRKTGGLADTVDLWSPRTGRGTGIVFESFDASALRWAITSALDVFREKAAYARLQQNGMARDFSWEHQVLEYEQLYRRITARG